MKIAFDVDVLAKQMGITQMVHQVADWGYKYIEQSPHPRINPFYKHPKASRECLTEYKNALKETGVEISSFIVVYHWSGPDEERRKAAVTNWKRMIEIAVEMGVSVINTELSGDPNQPVVCEEMWYRSMEELLPIIEREGIRVEIQSHPWDFCENHYECCDLVKSLYSENVKYLYCAAHTFFYDKGKGDVRSMLDYAGDDLSHVLIADTMNHTIDCRYIVNPPGVDATIHQHLGIGEGEVDIGGIFEKLREMDFANRTFKVGGESIIAAALFGYPEKMAKQAIETRERIERELLKK
ncbi:sugar phosphate isomerase/epimerase family protein [Petroclostridium xylanilyticum]|uniref:sugar phosphate isomerase/epimerase family protein n=1 Tax=Petroclostridium xylanilyticum TaxID=1792311 RepID=UPI000B99A315|nr:sugar phosphate isomerase/epimerase [Petroclostridium xylanilyticum]